MFRVQNKVMLNVGIVCPTTFEFRNEVEACPCSHDCQLNSCMDLILDTVTEDCLSAMSQSPDLSVHMTLLSL